MRSGNKALGLLLAFVTFCTASLPARADIINKPITFSAGQVLPATSLNQDFDAIYNGVNGNLSNINLKTGADIDPAKMDLTKAYGPILRAAAVTVWSAGNTGDTQPRVEITSDGKFRYGAGGSSAVDVMFKRLNSTTFAFRNASDSGDANITALAGTFSGAISGTTISGTSGTFSSSLQATALTLTATPLATTSGGTGADLSTVTAGQLITKDSGSSLKGATGVGGTGNGGTSGCATTGTIQGPCFHRGNWTTTGTITCLGCHIRVTGDVTIANPITASNAGWAGGFGSPINIVTIISPGFGPGGGGYCTTLGAGGGGGAGAGGKGNSGGSAVANVGGAGGNFPNNASCISLAGSGGAGGAPQSATNSGGAGGGGGGWIIVESGGNLTVTNAVTSGQISAIGSAGAAASGSAGGGGGGGGGTIALLCAGTLTLNNANQLAASGGAGGNSASAGGGGGGGGGWIHTEASAYTITTGTLSAASNCAGGAAGTGSATTPAGAGVDGVLQQQTLSQGAAPWTFP